MADLCSESLYSPQYVLTQQCCGIRHAALVPRLPLVFSEEIWLDHDPPYAVLPADAPAADLDGLVA